MGKDICVIIPFLNEESTVEITLAEVRKTIPSVYVIVVDNKSTDETAERTTKLANLVVPQPLMGKAENRGDTDNWSTSSHFKVQTSS